MTTYIFDFDSTITQVEALDILAEIVLKDNPDRDEVIAEIKEITNLNKNGTLKFITKIIVLNYQTEKKLMLEHENI